MLLCWYYCLLRWFWFVAYLDCFEWCAGLCGFRLLFCMLVVFVLGALVGVIGNAVLVLIVCFCLVGYVAFRLLASGLCV